MQFDSFLILQQFCYGRISEWISVDKDETGAPKGKSTLASRVGHEYVKSVHCTLLI